MESMQNYTTQTKRVSYFMENLNASMQVFPEMSRRDFIHQTTMLSDLYLKEKQKRNRNNEK